jgi:hypothetical protein
MTEAATMTGPTPEAENPSIIDRVDADPRILLKGEVKLSDYLNALEASAAIESGDISKPSVRDRIKSEAYAIARRKAAIDRTRKDMTEKWRVATAKVNTTGKLIETSLTELAADIRSPVTKWEESEAARQKEADEIITWLRESALVRFGETADVVAARLDDVRGKNLNDEILGDRMILAVELRDAAKRALEEAVTSLRHQEAMAAENARLKAENEAREAADAERERQRRADVLREQEEANAAERLRLAQEEAAERAREEERAAAIAREAEQERIRQAEIDEANARAAEAERLRKAESDRIEREAREAQERADAEAEAQRQREADIAHRQQVMGAAAEVLVPLGITKETALAIVGEIAAGNVPRVSISF